MKESPNQRWIREQREAFEANCEQQGFAADDDYWLSWLEVVAFSLLEQAHALLAHSIDASGESIESANVAVDRIIEDVDYFRLGPVYATVDLDGDGGSFVEAIQARLAALRAMPYSEFLRSPEWELQRRAALRRAGGRCETCNRGGRLHVHHRSYERRGAESAEDLVVLCGECHGAVHWHGGAHRPRV